MWVMLLAMALVVSMFGCVQEATALEAAARAMRKRVGWRDTPNPRSFEARAAIVSLTWAIVSGSRRLSGATAIFG